VKLTAGCPANLVALDFSSAGTDLNGTSIIDYGPSMTAYGISSPEGK
jgi:hypothetical protein